MTVAQIVPIPNANRYATFRGHRKAGFYCNPQQSVCIQTKAIGEQCDTDKEQHLYWREHVRYSFRILATLVNIRR